MCVRLTSESKYIRVPGYVRTCMCTIALACHSGRAKYDVGRLPENANFPDFSVQRSKTWEGLVTLEAYRYEIGDIIQWQELQIQLHQ